MKQGTNLHVYTWSRLGGFAPARPQCSAFTSYIYDTVVPGSRSVQQFVIYDSQSSVFPVLIHFDHLCVSQSV